MKRNLIYRILFLGVCFHITTSLSAAGTYSEGWTVAKLTQFESRGLIFDSYEGLLEVTTFNPQEACAEEKDECFIPTKQKVEFSVRPENADVVNFLSKNLNQEILVQYRIHRFEPVALSTDYEVIGAQIQEKALPKDGPDKFVGKKTGSKRNFSVTGRILSLEYRGTLIGTWEGLYLDETRGKVHPFSVTDEEVAAFATSTLKYGAKYFLGVSVAFATGWRESHYDLFEVNYKAPAGAVEATTPKK
ncbi:hypothetical protein EHQ27_03020 [Leptospira wolffii]|uniref:surface adhesion protein Lsa26 n=1 Tax=Leptospira wolffii TaxID=409998 RepID=UPI0003460DF9|nr:hypothetical protein [Leptospira wolffii]TGK64845.1 hypothetical protein EHQ32_01090 [Leptospira wolffii]TGK76756.1 hypothetical protein EHQ35_00125 [Leptospira wolffii]TGK77392.1 hypothetical protein EHQ27_03020 [Leptospira wolffii]TGL26787.1 hypothetical protein EHQ57_18925 [Leptospira wolffii]